ncbi:MAG: hypothetical protein CSA52_01690 [Gammaproteobacteria bacterium]|nr:MAG: hypothetical protein CSB48_02995 [Pseudomonadota bacterium]PIE38624.1 MAG: hypothetical protein CSA52_01690 [Gammaproteobacteria bacterium]
MRTITLFTLLLTLGMSTNMLWASHGSAEQEAASRQKAAQIAKHSPEDQVLKVEKRNSPNGPVYRVKILGNGGRVRSVYVDIRSGQVIHLHQ